MPHLGITFQGTRVSGRFVTQRTGCVMCGQIHKAPGCTNRDSPAPPTTTCVPAPLPTPEIGLSSHRGAAQQLKQQKTFVIRQRNHIFPAGIGSSLCCLSWLSSLNALFHTSHPHFSITHPQQCPHANPHQEGAQRMLESSRMNDLDNCY